MATLNIFNRYLLRLTRSKVQWVGRYRYATKRNEEAQRMMTKFLSSIQDLDLEFLSLHFKPGTLENEFLDWDIEERNKGVFTYGNIFGSSFESLMTLQKDEVMDKKYVSPFATLHNFLQDKEKHEACLQRFRSKTKQLDIYGIITTHLLKQLVHGNKFIIPYPIDKESISCPCGQKECQEVMSLNWGHASEFDTSDVMVFQGHQCSACLIFSPERDVTEEAPHKNALLKDLSRNSLLEESHKDFVVCDPVLAVNDQFDQVFIRRCYASVVKLSVLYGSKFSISVGVGEDQFSPIICLTGDEFHICIYEPGFDFFLRTSDPIPLWQGNRLVPESIYKLWMCLHYDLFYPSLNLHPKLLHNNTFGFLDFIGKENRTVVKNTMHTTDNPFIPGRAFSPDGL